MTETRLRVMFFVPQLGGGGAEKHALRVANALDPARFEVWVAAARRGGRYEALLEPHVHLEHTCSERVRSSTWSMLASLAPLRRLVARVQPDVLCPVLDHASVVALSSVRGLSPRPALVPSVQNPPKLNHASLRHGSYLLPLMQRSFPLADHAIALTEGVQGDVVALCPALSGRVSVIPNACLDGTLRDLARRQPDEPRPEGPLLLACGRLERQKDFPTLLDAFARVRERRAATLWILGEGPDRPALEAQVQRLGLDDHVRLLGFRDNPFAYMAAADLFVLSSVYEGLGMVIPEALACGTPVVSTDCPFGPAEILRDGESGLLCPVGDSAALAACILRVLDEPELRRRLTQKGARRARDYESATIAEAYGTLFARVAGERRAPGAVES